MFFKTFCTKTVTDHVPPQLDIPSRRSGLRVSCVYPQHLEERSESARTCHRATCGHWTHGAQVADVVKLANTWNSDDWDREAGTCTWEIGWAGLVGCKANRCKLHLNRWEGGNVNAMETCMSD